MKTVDLRRHAEVSSDRHELNAIGIGQAERLARDLSDLPIFSSPAKRARDTAVWILVAAAMPATGTDSPAGELMDGSQADPPSSAKRGGPRSSIDEAASALAREVVQLQDLGFGDQEKRWRDAAERAGSSHLDALKEEDGDLVASEAGRVASGVRRLFDRVSEGQRLMAIGHSPLIETAAKELLPGTAIEPLSEAEGIRLTLEDDGTFSMVRLQRPKSFLERPLGRILGAFLLAPVLAFAATWPVYALLTWSFSTDLVAVQAIAVTLGLALTTLFLAFTVATGKQREILLSGAKSRSRVASRIKSFFAPTWQGLAFMLVFMFLLSVLSFGSVTALLYQRGVASIGGNRVTHDTIMAKSLDFYMWQLIDTIPVLEIPETARLSAPYTYDDHWTGTLVVIFKAFIILPLIRTAILAYRKLTQERPLVS